MQKKRTKYSEWLLHSVECAYYSNDCSADVIEQLQGLYKKIKELWLKTPFISSKKVFEDMMKQVLDFITEFEDYSDEMYNGMIRDISDKESSWLKDFAKENLNKDYSIPANLAASVLFGAVAGMGTYKDISQARSQRIAREVTSELRTAYLTKQPLNKVTEHLERKEKLEEKRVETETKDISQGAFNLTDYMIYKRNNETIVYSSILDTNTCLECASMHGQRFKVEDAPSLPLHNNCKCELVPEDVFEDNNSVTNFSDWIESLSEDDKKKVLGKWRYELYQKGIKPSQFVDKDGVIAKKDWK